jgi:hypothetical protein
MTYNWQFWTIGLQEHLPSPTLSACSACYLSHHGEGSLIGSEIGLVEHSICREYSYNRDIVEVQTLGNHLRAYEQVGLACRELGYYAFVGIASASGVEVHTGYASLWEGKAEIVFHLLCTCTTISKVGVATIRTGDRHLHGVTAIMARETVGCLVVGKGDITVGTLWTPATLTTLHHRREASTVLEYYGLLTIGEGFAYGIGKVWGEQARHYPAMTQVLGVNHVDIRHL